MNKSSVITHVFTPYPWVYCNEAERKNRVCETKGKCEPWSHRLGSLRHGDKQTAVTSSPQNTTAMQKTCLTCKRVTDFPAKQNLQRGGRSVIPSTAVCPAKVPLSHSLITFCILAWIRVLLEMQIKPNSATWEENGQIFNMQYWGEVQQQCCLINTDFKTHGVHVLNGTKQVLILARQCHPGLIRCCHNTFIT